MAQSSLSVSPSSQYYNKIPNYKKTVGIDLGGYSPNGLGDKISISYIITIEL